MRLPHVMYESLTWEPAAPRDLLAQSVAGAVLEHYDFSRFAQVVEVSGQYGVLLPQLLERHRWCQGVLYGPPASVAEVRRQLQRTGVASRCTLLAGDVLDDVPPGADAYVLAGVIHTFDDAASLRLLTSCRQALVGCGRLFVIERLLPRAVDRLAEPGYQRTEAQYAALLAVAGWTIAGIIPTRLPVHIIEARPTWTGRFTPSSLAAPGF